MPEPTFRSIVLRQIQLLQHVSETLMARALAGTRTNLDDLFATQDHLEHWLQYLSPLALEPAGAVYEAPPPLPHMRPAPPLPHEMEEYNYGRARETIDEERGEAGLHPRVEFPPEPLWVDDLERDQGEREG